MSIFSKIKGSKQAAQKHKAAQASTPPTAAPTPYRHIPTHAAFDALTGAPAGWKAEDRPAIQEANRKRMSRSISSISMSTYATSNRLVGNSSPLSVDASITSSGSPTSKMAKRNSSSVSCPPQPVHLGYVAYDGFGQARFGRNRSNPGKSPLSSQPITPADSQSVASSSSLGTLTRPYVPVVAKLSPPGVLELPTLGPLESLENPFDLLDVPRNVQRQAKKSVQWKVESNWAFNQSPAISAH